MTPAPRGSAASQPATRGGRGAIQAEADLQRQRQPLAPGPQREARQGESESQGKRSEPEAKGAIGARPESPAARAEARLVAKLSAAGANRSAVRYRGFVLLPQSDLGWLVRPERSPMTVLPFRTPPISLSDVKALVDWRLDGDRLTPPALEERRAS